MTGYGLDLLVLWRNLFNRGQSRPQSAFLQLFGGVTLAAEAAALADRARAFSCRQLPRDRLGGVAVQQRRAQSRRCRKRLAMSFLPSTVRIQPRPHGLTRGAIGRQAWQDLHHIDVQAELRQPSPFLQAGVRRALVFALQAVRDADFGEGVGTGITPTRAWTLFMLRPRMLLARPGADRVVGRRMLHRTSRPLRRGDWPALLASLRGSPPHRPDGSRATEESDAVRKRRESAGRLVRKGEVSRARHLLSGALAPGDAGTWAALTDPSKRPDRPATSLVVPMFTLGWAC